MTLYLPGIPDFYKDWDAPEEPPADLGWGVFYKGLIHWLGGLPDSCKTTLAANLARHVTQEHGMTVLWLNGELSLPQLRGRFRRVGIDPSLSDRVRPVFMPVLPGHGDAVAIEKDVTAMLGRFAKIAPLDQLVIVLDSFSTLYGAATGKSDNDNADVQTWITNVLYPLRQEGATILVIDHPGRVVNKRDPFVAKGASAKGNSADVQYASWVTEPPTPTQPGTFTLVGHKDREAVLRRVEDGGPWLPSKYGKYGETWFSVGDGAGGLPVTPAAAPEPTATMDDQRADQIVAYFTENALDGTALKKAAVNTALKFKGGGNIDRAWQDAVERGDLESTAKGYYRLAAAGIAEPEL